MASADYGLLGQFKGVGGAMREAEDRALQQQILQAKLQSSLKGGDAPAAIQIANEYAKAREAGDIQRMNDIAMAAKSFDKGIMVNQEGAFNPLQGYGQAVGSIEAAKTGMKQQAEKDVDLVMNPQIKGAESRAGEIGKQTGEKETLYKSAISRLPQLNKTVDALSALGKEASYTYGGRGIDAIARQVGVTTDTAKARAEYISKVDNEILPLLRDTFGAAFTQKEGETLKATLGAPNMSPQEKDAVLRSFITSKYDTLESMGREIGQTPELPPLPNVAGGGDNIDAILNKGLQPATKLKSPPKQAIQYLRSNPQAAAEFDAKYGKGASRMVLGK
jgi:hypothetical protein